MLTPLRPVRNRLAAKLYAVIALALAVVCGLAGLSARFAHRAADTIAHTRDEGLAPLLLLSRAEILLGDARRLVAAASFQTGGPDAEAARQNYKAASDEIGELLQSLGYARSHPLLRRLEIVAAQGEAVFGSTLANSNEQSAARARYQASSDDLKQRLALERQQRMNAAEAGLDELAGQSHALSAWVLAVAGIASVLIGPLGLFLLRRLLKRLQAVGAALGRLARNDTSIDIPGLDNRDEVGEFARAVAVFKAKSIELLQKKAELERVNVQLDVALNNIPVGLSMFDAQERLLVCNSRYAEMYQLPGELTVPGTVDCAHWDHRTKQGARHRRADLPDDVANCPDGSAPMMIELGDQRVIAVSRQPLKGGGWIALHEDVTEQHRQEQEIIHLARHDPLTNLANRALFKEQLHQALQRLARGQGFAVLCLDLDRFKAVNDTLGHPVGDALLKQVSERLLSCVRQGDLVARLGGDEFAILQTSARDPSQTESLASRIVETVSSPYYIEGHRIEISTSIGMTLAPRDGSDADQLMKNADVALYRIKAGGRRGYAFFKPEMNDVIAVRRMLESDLRRALDNDSLDISYLPVIALDTRRITGFEALPRLSDPVHGPRPCEELVTVAEETGLTGEVGEWTLRRACIEAARWSQPVRVAVNVAPSQIKRNLVELVLQVLADSRLPADRLELEIGEAVQLQDSQNTLAMLHQLRQLGVRIVMDDFGTGYGSLSHLRSFPFDKVKIAGSLIGDLVRADDCPAVVDAVIGLGRKLGMTTAADGIESEQQLEQLRAFGCTEGQGYYLGAGVGAQDVESILAASRNEAQSAA